MSQAAHAHLVTPARPQPPRTAWVVMAKAPLAGLAKTRLIPALGAEGAAALAVQMLRHTLVQVLAAAQPDDPVALACAPNSRHPAWTAALATTPAPALPRLTRIDQPNAGLGARMQAAVDWGLAQAPAVVLMGTDAPALSAQGLRQAASALAAQPTVQPPVHSAVLGPTLDGGYVLIGLRQSAPSLFDDAHLAWGTASVAEQTRQRLQALGWKWAECAPLADIDTPGDLVHLPTDWLRAAHAAEALALAPGQALAAAKASEHLSADTTTATHAHRAHQGQTVRRPPET